MHWERIVGPVRGDLLRAAILRALQQAYDENCRRHAPEDLGDNNITFGVSVSQNLRFLLERELAQNPLAGVDIIRPRGSFALAIDGRYELYFYKAPPGVFDIRLLRFDASKTQLELVEANTAQLAFDFGPSSWGEVGELNRLACIHFGDALEGLRRADVGAPLQSRVDGLRWHWAECLSSGEIVIDDAPLTLGGHNEDDDEDFDLRLRADERDLGMTDESAG